MRMPSAAALLAARTTTIISVDNDVMSQALIQDVENVHNGCLVNTNLINGYTGGNLPTTEFNGTTVLSTFAAIYGAQTKLLIDSEMSPNLTLENTVSVAETVLNTLQYSVPDTIEALENKKSELDAAGLTYVVWNSLQIFLTNHVTAGEAGGVKLDKGNQTVMAAMEDEVKTVTAKIQEGVAMFSS